MKRTQKGIEQGVEDVARILIPESQFAPAGINNVMATVKPSPPKQSLRSGSVDKSNALAPSNGSHAPAPRSSDSASRQKASETEEMELLLSHDVKSRKQSTAAATSVKFHIVLLLIGVIGSLACLWTMLYTARGEEVAYNLGLERVANSLENILQLLAYPVLMFLIVLSAYAGQQLYRAYRAANDPETYRRER